jgi:hypothetical protein
MATEKAKPSPGEAPKDVERVRDIIFGPQMRDYDQRFHTIQRDIERLRQELEQLNERMGELDREQGKRVQIGLQHSQAWAAPARAPERRL